MITLHSRRTMVRLVTFCIVFFALFIIFFTRFEVGRASVARSERSLCRFGVDLLNEGIASFALGDDVKRASAYFDAAMSILPLDAETADSLTRFVDAANNSPDDARLASYARTLAARLQLVSDMLTSPPDGLKDPTTILAQLDLALPLPEIGEDDAGENSVGYKLLEGRPEVSEGFARDIAESVIGVKVGLRVSEQDESPQVYTFSVSNAFADITRNGGLLLRYSMRHTPKEAKLSVDEGLKVLDEFVFAQKYGAIKLRDTYEVSGIIWAEYTVNGDESGGIIKAGVASDTGKVCYFDASDYLRRATMD